MMVTLVYKRRKNISHVSLDTHVYIYFLFANLLILLIHRHKSYHSQ